MESVHYVDAALIVVFLALLVALVTLRVRTQRRRTRLATARALRDADRRAPCERRCGAAPTRLDELERGALLDAGLAALLELRGRERERVAVLLEEAGVMDAEATALRSGGPDHRRQAADALGLIASPATREPLRAALQDEDVLVRLAAARGLAELGDADEQWSTELIADAAADEHHLGALAELILALGARAPARLGSVYFNSRSSEVLSLGAVVLEDAAFGRNPRWSDLRRIVLYSVGENLGYRQVTHLWKLEAFWRLWRGGGWGTIERKGLSREVQDSLASEIGMR